MTEINNRATSIVIEWDDGMRHLWTPQRDGTWTLRLTDPGAPTSDALPLVTGYDAENVCRVVTTAVESNDG
jgi:hypothetical protein